jgi:tRNA pseudouridine32 synthase / 23S rRNA pseudouridine746 synthase
MMRPMPNTPQDDLHCLHVDAHLLVLNKPSGLLTVPGRGPGKQDCLIARAQARWPDALVVHRLDMATSGLVLLARGKAMQRALSEAFAQRVVGKRYVAIVHGQPAAQSGEINLPLITDWPQRPRQKVDHEIGKPSLTHYQVLAGPAPAGCSRLALEPLTGRSHQLRVHLWALGHPILGDALYAPPEVQALAPRLQLHAQQLQLAHPASGEPLHFELVAEF